MAAGVATLSTSDLVRLRMHALGLTHNISSEGSKTSPADRVIAAVNHLGALQGQDWRASQWAIGVRTPGATVTDVAAAFNAREIVRSWPMRGTVHITRAQDIGWIQALTGARVVAGASKRREFLGITDTLLDRLVTTSLDALAGGTSLDREQLSSIWSDAGIEWKSNWRYHLIWWMCQNNLTTFGPVEESPAAVGSASEPRLVLAEEWITNPRHLAGDEALVALAHAYVRGRGAVQHKDFAWWSGLAVGGARRGLELAAEHGLIVRAQLSDVTGASGVIWADPGALDAATQATGTLGAQLLPGFDEHLLGYTNRVAQLDPHHFDRVVPGRNGVFLPTVVQHGRTVGTWKRAPQAGRAQSVSRGDVLVSPFPGEDIDMAACTDNVARWAAFAKVEVPAIHVNPER